MHENEMKVDLEALLASGELVDGAEFYERTGWTQRELDSAVLDGRVFCLEVGGVGAYPTFYTDPRYNREHVEAVTQLLGDISGGSKWLFFTTPKGSLAARTPLAALVNGDLDRVKRAATGYAQR